MSEYNKEQEQEARKRLQQMLPDIRVIQMIYVASKLGIADLLGKGPTNVEKLANASKVHAHTLYRLLRGLASLGIFREIEPRKFELTDMAELLRSDIPDSMRNQSLWSGEPWRWRPFGELLYSVRTGQPAFPYLFGQKVFDYLAENPAADEIFNQDMVDMTTRQGIAVVDSYDFGHEKLVIDIGGGHGALIAAILKRYPAVQGAIFDLPAVVENGRGLLSTADVIDRCDFVGGSFFEVIPGGGDIYIMKLIIHDWDDEHALSILRNCRTAMERDSTLLLIEWVIPSGNDPHHGKIVDMEMLALFGSQERTLEEYRRLLGEAGFELTSIIPTSEEIDIIEAVPL